MEQVGRIVEYKNGIARVQVVRKSACGGDCGKCMGCPSTGIVAEARNPLHAGVGDYVEISSDNVHLKKAVVWVYIIPLIALFIGFAAGTLIYEWLGWRYYQEVLQLASGLAFMGATYAVLSRMDKKRRCDFEVIKIIAKSTKIR